MSGAQDLDRLGQFEDFRPLLLEPLVGAYVRGPE